MARLFLSPGEEILDPFGGQSTSFDVFGTNDLETVSFKPDAIAVLDPSFNKGGDTINIAGASTNFDGNLSGSNFILTSPAGANIAIPVGTTGATISFADGSYTLQFNGTNVLLGAQIITETPESLDDLDSMPALSATFGDDTAAGSESSTFG
ncbi:MAG: hypothetical protein R3E09_12525 [Novosphingobium sp.]|nr:hypothetical protein [Novosphingobium sp.]